MHWMSSNSSKQMGIRVYSTSSKPEETASLTHLDDSGRASMVDVSPKTPTKRSATAVGTIYIPKIAYDLVTRTYRVPAAEDGSTVSPEVQQAVEKAQKKGDTLMVAQLAGIMGAKKTSDLIPLCHPLALSKVSVDLWSVEATSGDEPCRIECEATVICEGKTGVEMEALTAVNCALLTVWDMLKAVAGRDMEMGRIYVSRKSGGKSGDFVRTVTA